MKDNNKGSEINTVGKKTTGIDSVDLISSDEDIDKEIVKVLANKLSEKHKLQTKSNKRSEKKKEIPKVSDLVPKTKKRAPTESTENGLSSLRKRPQSEFKNQAISELRGRISLQGKRIKDLSSTVDAMKKTNDDMKNDLKKLWNN